jgi:hypothetical protein
MLSLNAEFATLAAEAHTLEKTIAANLQSLFGETEDKEK